MTTREIHKNAQQRLIRRKEVQAKTGLGVSSIYALMKIGKFPQSLNISERRVAWIEAEIDQWITERIALHKATITTIEA